MEEQGARVGFAHFGEDKIINFMFGENYGDGFFVDVGCYHPTLFSNTYLFYKRGWRGVLIDANPFMIDLCKEIRPEDTSLNIAIGAENGTATLYKFNDWGSSNTINPEFRDHISASQEVPVTETVNVEMRCLRSIFEEYAPEGKIDLINIDIEGVDIDALRGNDWAIYRPKILAIEDLGFDNHTPNKSSIHLFLTERGYRLESRAVFTSIYVASEARRALNPAWETPLSLVPKTSEMSSTSL